MSMKYKPAKRPYFFTLFLMSAAEDIYLGGSGFPAAHRRQSSDHGQKSIVGKHHESGMMQGKPQDPFGMKIKFPVSASENRVQFLIRHGR